MSVSTTMEAALRHAQTQPPLSCAAVRRDTILPATDLLAIVCPLKYCMPDGSSIYDMVNVCDLCKLA